MVVIGNGKQRNVLDSVSPRRRFGLGDDLSWQQRIIAAPQSGTITESCWRAGSLRVPPAIKHVELCCRGALVPWLPGGLDLQVGSM